MCVWEELGSDITPGIIRDAHKRLWTALSSAAPLQPGPEAQVYIVYHLTHLIRSLS